MTGTSGLRFAGRRALVTGAGSGIGRAVARRLASEGAEVIGLDVSETGLRETFEGISGSRCRVVDVTGEEAIEAVAQAAPADVLVNAAGVLSRWPLLDHPVEDWRRTLDVNVRAPYRLSREFARGHIDHGARGPVGPEAGGHIGREASGHAKRDDRGHVAHDVHAHVERASGAAIVNVCSIESYVAIPGHAAYTASKAALLMLTRAFALELASHGIRVNGLAPGVTATGMNEAMRNDPERQRSLLDAIPLGRFATAEEQAAAVCFLASDEASYITGAVLASDGGWLTR